jgi:hypothetical protein
LLRFFGAFVFIWNPSLLFWHIELVDVIIVSLMPEFLLPSPDSSRNQFPSFTREFGVPLDVYRGYFSDNGTEICAIVDTTDHPHIEDGELHSVPVHEVSVFEVSDGTKRRINPLDAGRYPFTARVESSALRLPLIKLFPDIDIVVLQGPKRGADDERRY